MLYIPQFYLQFRTVRYSAEGRRVVKLLVVEDETKTAAYLKRALSEHGFAVDVSHEGEEGLGLALQYHYDLLIIDILLPGRDGWSVLTELRHSRNEVPV